MSFSNPFKALSKFEVGLWLGSVLVILLSFILGKNASLLTVVASLIGATALIFLAKGYVLGQVLVVIFSVLYSLISWDFRYYGEMITYAGMTLPIAVLSIIAWIKHPYEANKAEVKISKLSRSKTIWMLVLTIIITTLFYFILAAFNTPNLTFSTISVATSFLASYMMLFRSPAYALAYAANDVVLITLWVLACFENSTYLPMVICFSTFFLNDIYGFFNWMRMLNRQNNSEEISQITGQTEKN